MLLLLVPLVAVLVPEIYNRASPSIGGMLAIELQLIGGVIVIQILPAVVLGLYTRWFHRWALAVGWVVGMGISVYMLYVTPSKTATHFGSASFAFSTWGFNTKVTIWTGIVGVAANLIVATVLSLLFSRLPRGRDETRPADYEEAEAPAMPLTGHAARAK